MRKIFSKTFLIFIFALIMSHALAYMPSHISFAAITGINNNKSPWAKKINQALDGIGAKIVDSALDDEADRKKYEGMEQWEIDKLIAEEEAKKASESLAKKASMSEVIKATKSAINP